MVLNCLQTCQESKALSAILLPQQGAVQNFQILTLMPLESTQTIELDTELPPMTSTADTLPPRLVLIHTSPTATWRTVANTHPITHLPHPQATHNATTGVVMVAGLTLGTSAMAIATPM